MYKIIFNCDLLGDHAAPIASLCMTDSIKFTDLFEALRFIRQCTSPITQIKELAPNLVPWAYSFVPDLPDELYNDNDIYNFKLEKNIHQVANTEDFKSLL